MGEAGLKIAWLNCKPDSRHTGSFFLNLAASLEASGVAPPQSCPSVRSLSRALAESTASGAILLDQYEEASGAQNDRVLLDLARELPPGWTIIVATRQRPTFSLMRQMVSGDVYVIDGNALRLRADERGALLAGCDATAGAEALIEAAAGWPAILSLAALTIAGRAGDASKEVLGTLRGHIRDYIVSEILAPLDPRLREFLLDTSVLDEIGTDAANAIRSAHDSHEFIQLTEMLAPLATVTAQPFCARLHPLLREVLQTELERTDPQRLKRLHVAAAEHHACSARVYEAVMHALNAKDVAQAVRVIERSGPLALQVSEGPRGVRHLLDLLPRDVVSHNIRLGLTRVVQLAMEENVLEAKLEYERLEREMQAQPDLPEIVRLELEIVRCVAKIYESEHSLDADVWPSISHAAERARRWVLDDPRLLAIPCAIELLFLLRTGQIDVAENRLNELDQLFRRLRMSRESEWLWAYRSVVHFGRLEFDAAEALLLRALRVAEDTFGVERSPIADFTHACLARLYFHRNLIDEALRHIEALGDAPSWNVIEVLEALRVLKARCYIAQGRCSDALHMLRESRRAAAAKSLYHLKLISGATEVELLARLGRLPEARAVADEIDLPNMWQLALASQSLPWVDIEAAAKGLFALAIAHQDLSAADEIANQCVARAGGAGHLLAEINAALLKTRASQLLGQTAQARKTLGGAIAKMRGLDGLRLLLDAGPELVPTLRAIVDQRDAPIAQWACAVMAALEDDVRRWMSADPLFTAREQDVFAGLLRAASTKEIARQLELSPETVKCHLKAIFGKLRVRDRNEAVAEAWRRVLDRQIMLGPARAP